MTTSTQSSLLNTAPATPVIRPLCQKPPSPMTLIGRLLLRARHRRGRGQRHAVAEDRVALAEGREGRERSGSRCRPTTCTGPISWRSSFMAENTGRSGQPVQKVGGRGGSGAPSSLVDLGVGAPRPRRSTASSGGDGAAVAAQNAARPLRHHQRRVFARHRQHVLAVQPACCRSALRRIWPIACSRKSGAPSSTTSTAFLPAQKRAISLGHQRMHDVEHQRRHARRCRRRRSGRRAPAGRSAR